LKEAEWEVRFFPGFEIHIFPHRPPSIIDTKR